MPNRQTYYINVWHFCQLAIYNYKFPTQTIGTDAPYHSVMRVPSSRKPFSAGSPSGYWNLTFSSPNWFLVAPIQVIGTALISLVWSLIKVGDAFIHAQAFFSAICGNKRSKYSPHPTSSLPSSQSSSRSQTQCCGIHMHSPRLLGSHWNKFRGHRHGRLASITEIRIYQYELLTETLHEIQLLWTSWPYISYLISQGTSFMLANQRQSMEFSSEGE